MRARQTRSWRPVQPANGKSPPVVLQTRHSVHTAFLVPSQTVEMYCEEEQTVQGTQTGLVVGVQGAVSYFPASQARQVLHTRLVVLVHVPVSYVVFAMHC